MHKEYFPHRNYQLIPIILAITGDFKWLCKTSFPDPFENFLDDLFKKTKNSKNTYHVAGDFDLNVLDLNKSKKWLDVSNWYDTNHKIPAEKRLDSIRSQSY